MWANFGLFVGAYMLIHAVAVMLCRWAHDKPLPYEGAEPKLVLMLNRIIGNMNEQLFIIGPLLFAVTTFNPLGW
jgi:hypothetical protein